MTEPTTEIGVIGIVGAGVMGAGIAQVALEAGREVVLFDVDPAAIDRARDSIRTAIDRRSRAADAEGGSTLHAAEVLTRVRAVPTLDALAAEAELIIESVIEDLDLKRTVVAALDGAAPPDVILATNTSALAIADIAQAAATDPGRVIGLHFFNPVPRMDLVEVVAGPATSSRVSERAWGEMLAWGKTPVRCADSPGFIVNRVNRPFTIEALRLLETGAADVPGIDAAMRAAGFPMGPFELMDLAGLDVNLAAATSIWERLERPDRLRPSAIQEQLVAAGRLGRKKGIGFYRYEHGRRAESADLVGPGRGSSRSLPDHAIQSRIVTAIDAEARRALDEGVASADDIDTAMRAGARHPAGPFERMAAASARGGSPPTIAS